MFKKFKGHYSKRKTHKTDRDVMSYEDMPLDDYEQEKTEMSPQAVKKIVLGACIAIAAGLIVFAFATRGATRQTENYTLGNIVPADDYMKAGAQVTMLTDHGMFIPSMGAETVWTAIFHLHTSNATGLRADGLVYPLGFPRNWWQGTLNEATGTEFYNPCEGDYLVYLNYKLVSPSSRPLRAR